MESIAEAARPAWQRLWGGRAEPGWARSSTSDNASERRRLRADTGSPRCVRSISGGEDTDPARLQPRTGTVRPTCAVLCEGGEGPMCRKSGAGRLGPKHPKLLAGTDGSV